MDKLKRIFSGNKKLLAGTVITLVMVLIAIIGLVYTPYDPNAMDAANKLSGPTFKHLLGCDNFGRDVLSRMFVGLRMTLFVACGTVLIGIVLGTIVGALTGYYGGIVDELLMRFNDAVLAFPSILLALVFITILGSGTYQVMIALGIVFFPSYARIVRGEFLKCKNLDYVRSARLLGASDLRIMFVHILPNIVPVLLSTLVIGFNNAVLAEAGMSFLGIGVQPPNSSLGAMLSDAQSFLFAAPMYALAPGIMIAVLILGFSLVGDGLSAMQTGSNHHSLNEEMMDNAIANGTSQNGEENSLSPEAVRESGKDYLLDVTDLSIEIFDKDKSETVVYDFDLSVSAGEIVGIVGESGSGKTMSALAIAGLLSRRDMKKKGKIIFEGKDILGLQRSELRKIQGNSISMIFQEPMTSLNPVKKIGWQVEESLCIHTDFDAETRKDKAIRMLRNVEIENAEEVYERYPHELSGGQRQRVMIAAALVTHPKLLIADEPTTALDVTVQSQIIDLLKRINKNYGTSILFISHDLSLVKQLCSKVLVMQHGRVVEMGDAEAIFENPKKSYTQKLIASIPKFEKITGREEE